MKMITLSDDQWFGSKWTVRVSVKFLKVFSAGFSGDSRFRRRLYEEKVE